MFWCLAVHLSQESLPESMFFSFRSNTDLLKAKSTHLSLWKHALKEVTCISSVNIRLFTALCILKHVLACAWAFSLVHSQYLANPVYLRRMTTACDPSSHNASDGVGWFACCRLVYLHCHSRRIGLSARSQNRLACLLWRLDTRSNLLRFPYWEPEDMRWR